MQKLCPFVLLISYAFFSLCSSESSSSSSNNGDDGFDYVFPTQGWIVQYSFTSCYNAGLAGADISNQSTSASIDRNTDVGGNVSGNADVNTTGSFTDNGSSADFDYDFDITLDSFIGEGDRSLSGDIEFSLVGDYNITTSVEFNGSGQISGDFEFSAAGQTISVQPDFQYTTEPSGDTLEHTITGTMTVSGSSMDVDLSFEEDLDFGF